MSLSEIAGCRDFQWHSLAETRNEATDEEIVK